MVATIYYLDWGREDADETARELFSRLHGASPDTLPIEYYRRVGTTHIADEKETEMDALRHIYHYWNATDDQAHDPIFKHTLICDQCDSRFTTTSNDDVVDVVTNAANHAEAEHGWEYPFKNVKRDELPDYIHGLRSMSVGDVIDLDGTLYMVASFGFDEIEWADDQPELDHFE